MKNSELISNATNSLRSKSDVRVVDMDKYILVLDNSSLNKICDLGNGSWGKIDFLVRKDGYNFSFVPEFPKRNESVADFFERLKKEQSEKVSKSISNKKTYIKVAS